MSICMRVQLAESNRIDAHSNHVKYVSKHALRHFDYFLLLFWNKIVLTVGYFGSLFFQNLGVIETRYLFEN